MIRRRFAKFEIRGPSLCRQRLFELPALTTISSAALGVLPAFEHVERDRTNARVASHPIPFAILGQFHQVFALVPIGPD